MIERVRRALSSRTVQTLARGAGAGFPVGLATGLVAATVDAVNAAMNPFSGGLPTLVFSIVGLLVPLLSVLGAALGAYLALFVERTQDQQRFTASVATSSLAVLPFLAFVLWVPAGWIGEHWPDLSPAHRRLTVAALAAITLAVLVAARTSYGVARRWAKARLRPVWGYLACVALGFAATLAYWADAVLYEGDYEDFHYGLAVGFLALVALLFVVMRALVIRRRPHTSGRFPRRWSRAVAAVLFGVFVLVSLLPATSFGRSNALVFGKLLVTTRSLGDVDADGYSSILGGGDCAPFDPRFSPGALEVPENGTDDDCSGSDAEWPVAPPPPSLPNPAPRWNVLLVTIDALRADHVGAYGYKRKTTPHLDRLAKRSLVFTEAYAQAPKTTDSLPSLLTGSYPSNIQRDAEAGTLRWSYALAPEARPLALLLRAHGYGTGAGTGFHLRQVTTGFDFFEMAEPTVSAAKFLASTAKPFFLWLHYAEPHEPYVRHREYNFGPKAIDRYDGEIAYADAQFGEVLKILDRKKLLDSTVIIVTADHGEEFGEHGGYSHTRKLYRELLHVPLILKVPGMKPDRIGETVELVDIVPTLCELLGLKMRDGEQDGQSLLDPKRSRRLRGAYAEDLRQPSARVVKRAFFDGRFRLIDDRANDRLELYESRRDKREQRDLGHEHPEVLARLRETLSVRSLRRHTKTFRTLVTTDDAETWARLFPTIRRAEMVDRALDHFPRTASPAHEAVLQALLARPGVPPSNRAKAERLLSGR